MGFWCSVWICGRFKITFYLTSANVLDSLEVHFFFQVEKHRMKSSLLPKAHVDLTPAGLKIWLMRWDHSKSFSNPLYTAFLFTTCYYWLNFPCVKLHFSEKSQFPLAFRFFRLHSIPAFQSPVAIWLLVFLQHFGNSLSTSHAQPALHKQQECMKFNSQHLQLPHSNLSEEISSPINDLPL